MKKKTKCQIQFFLVIFLLMKNVNLLNCDEVFSKKIVKLALIIHVYKYNRTREKEEEKQSLEE